MSHITETTDSTSQAAAAQCPAANTAQGTDLRWWQRINWFVPLVAILALAVMTGGAFCGRQFRADGYSPPMIWTIGALGIVAFVATPRQPTYDGRTLLWLCGLGYTALVIAFYWNTIIGGLEYGGAWIFWWFVINMG